MQCKVENIAKKSTIVLVALIAALCVFALSFLQWRRYLFTHDGEIQQIWSPDNRIDVYYLAGGSTNSPFHKVLVRKRWDPFRHILFSVTSSSDNPNLKLALMWEDSYHLKVICQECDDLVQYTKLEKWDGLSVSYFVKTESGLRPMTIKYVVR